MGHASMTSMTKLLRQGVALRHAATESTNDVNEAYFIVHEVMSDAFARNHDGDHPLAPSLAAALLQRSRKLANTATMV